MFNNSSWQVQQLALILQNQFQLQQQQLQQYQQLQQQNNSAFVINSSCDEDEEEEDDDSDDKRTLFVANLDEQVTEELLYELFLQAGPLEAVNIPKDTSGRRRTFGFVVFSHQCSLPYALQLFDGLSLFRKPITIKPKINGAYGSGSASRKRRAQPSAGYDNVAGLCGNPFKVHLGNTSMLPSDAPNSQHPATRHNHQREHERRQQTGSDRQRRQQHHQSGSSRRAEQRDNHTRR